MHSLNMGFAFIFQYLTYLLLFNSLGAVTFFGWMNICDIKIFYLFIVFFYYISIVFIYFILIIIVF